MLHSSICLVLQGNLIGRGVVEFCEGGPPVRIYYFTSVFFSNIQTYCFIYVSTRFIVSYLYK